MDQTTNLTGSQPQAGFFKWLGALLHPAVLLILYVVILMIADGLGWNKNDDFHNRAFPVFLLVLVLGVYAHAYAYSRINSQRISQLEKEIRDLHGKIPL